VAKVWSLWSDLDGGAFNFPRSMMNESIPGSSFGGSGQSRAGSYRRHLQTKAGEVTLKVPKLRHLPSVERYRRRQSSVEEALIEMYLAGVSVRRVEGITYRE
jgi:transposase-like protein